MASAIIFFLRKFFRTEMFLVYACAYMARGIIFFIDHTYLCIVSGKYYICIPAFLIINVVLILFLLKRLICENRPYFLSFLHICVCLIFAVWKKSSVYPKPYGWHVKYHSSQSLNADSQSAFFRIPGLRVTHRRVW